MSDDPTAEERLPLAELHEVVEASVRGTRVVGRGGERAPPVNKPPEGDWLGTQFLRFERHGPLAHVIVDRPEARNALTPAMYFGIRYAVDHVNRDPDLAGLLITGTGDVFMPGGDLGGANEDGWARPPDAARHGQHAVRRGAPVGQAGRHRGERHLRREVG